MNLEYKIARASWLRWWEGHMPHRRWEGITGFTPMPPHFENLGMYALWFGSHINLKSLMSGFTLLLQENVNGAFGMIYTSNMFKILHLDFISCVNISSCGSGYQLFSTVGSPGNMKERHGRLADWADMEINTLWSVESNTTTIIYVNLDII